jgi:hypothetical protein
MFNDNYVVELITSIGDTKMGRKKQPINVGDVLEVDEDLALNSKHLQGWKFFHSMIITGKRKFEEGIIVTDEKHFTSIGGVYAVYHGDELIYIGSYTNSFQHRWINKLTNKNCVKLFRHFKGEHLAEQVRKTNTPVNVYVLPLSQINKKFPDNRWVNQFGVESELIKHYLPALNKHHKPKGRIQ